MKIKDVISALECFAPLPLQEEYDNAGLQVGLTEAEVSGVLLCLDVTEAIVNEAKDNGCNMIVSHHPLLFRRLRQISDGDQVQRCVMLAIQNGITIVSMHTNLDSARGGVNYMIARQLGLQDIQLLDAREVNGVEGGAGVIGTLPHPLTAEQYIYKVKETFHAGCVMTNELLERPIRTIAICGGAGSFLLSNALRHGADALLTGEMHYHEYFGHEQEIQISVIGHYESEQYTSQLLVEIINDKCPGVRTMITKNNTNPIKYF
ncbi:MAG: Nif3-like dinuclear metal center hexameric protein [Prevotella sp.]|nr:Nif3-like dinuclear metal center hexameric protein [Candidatus Prevotella equi]